MCLGSLVLVIILSILDYYSEVKDDILLEKYVHEIKSRKNNMSIDGGAKEGLL